MIAKIKDVQAVRSVAINVAPEVIEPFIEDVEKQDIIPAIGAELYFAVEADPGNEMYRDLLYGGTYKDCSQNLCYLRGLITAVAYLAYSRLLIFGDIQYTAFGSVLKSSQYSQKPDEAEKIRAADAARKMGFAILKDVAKYIDFKFKGQEHTPTRVSRPKFISIKKERL